MPFLRDLWDFRYLWAICSGLPLVHILLTTVGKATSSKHFEASWLYRTVLEAIKENSHGPQFPGIRIINTERSKEETGFGQTLILYLRPFLTCDFPSDKQKDLMDWEFLMSSYIFALEKDFVQPFCVIYLAKTIGIIFSSSTKLYNNSALLTCFFWNTHLCHPPENGTLSLLVVIEYNWPNSFIHICASFCFQLWSVRP